MGCIYRSNHLAAYTDKYLFLLDSACGEGQVLLHEGGLELVLGQCQDQSRNRLFKQYT